MVQVSSSAKSSLHMNDEGHVHVGWREWLSLPGLNVPLIKAKVDTGARTSALHTFELETFQQSGKLMVKFSLHPIQKREDIVVNCEAEVIDQRWVRDSGGHKEQRYVIRTPISLGGHEWAAEITLTNRDSMLFRMLLGRSALGNGFVVDPSASYLTGRPGREKIEAGYRP